MSISFRIESIKGHAVDFDGNSLALREYSQYLVFGLSPTAQVHLGPVQSSWDPEREAFSLRIGFWHGRQVLTVVDGTTRREVHVQVEADPDKLPADATAAMLRELETWRPAITAGREGGTHGTLRGGGAAAPIVALSLGPLVPALERAIRAVLEHPKHRRVDELTDVALHAVRRVDGGTVRWLGRRADVFGAVEPRSLSARVLHNPAVPQFLAVDSLDHPVNRYLAGGLHRTVDLLKRASATLASAAAGRGVDPDSKVWYRARAKELSRGADALQALLRTSALRSVPAGPLSESAILALHDEPAYARAHELLRLFLSPAFQLQEVGTGVALRPSFELYELWTFYAVQQALATALATVPPDIHGLDELVKNASGEITAVHCDWSLASGALRLSFQPRFPSYMERGASERYSISRRRFPDLTVSWRPREGEGRWLCLDAKYRVKRQAVAEAFEKAHIYRDSLIWNGLGGRPVLALLLVPTTLKESAAWFEAEFSQRYGCGARELQPGVGPPSGLVAELLGALGVPTADRR